MASESFLTINGYPVSARESLEYLQLSGDAQFFIDKILRHYILRQEIQARADLEISSEEIEQAVIEFRLENQLTDRDNYHKWLTSNNIDSAGFHQKYALELKLQKLIFQITEPQLYEYFTERKPFLDLVVLSRIIVDQKKLAEEIRTSIEQGAKFEQMAQEHSLSDESILNGMMGAIKMGTLPENLKEAINPDHVGELIGPIQIDDQWGLFRVEQFLPASLYNEALKQELRLQLFDLWLVEKVQSLDVQILG